MNANYLLLLAASEEPAVGHWPLAFYLGLVLVMVLGMLGLSYLLGQRHEDRANHKFTQDVFESGSVPVGSGHARFGIPYLKLALFFLIFDLEVVFLATWAMVARETGMAGYLAMAVFVGMLILALAFLWMKGDLDWTRRHKKSSKPT